MTTDHPPRWNGDRYGAHRPRPATTPTAADRAEMADLELAARLERRADADLELAARLERRVDADDYTDAARLWDLAARAADLATRPDALTVEHLDALAQSALALAVDAEHRSRKQ